MFHELSDKTKNEILFKLTLVDLIIRKLENNGYKFNVENQNIINENNKIIIKENDNNIVEFDFNDFSININDNNYDDDLNQNEI
jgi:hypothetical protein